MGTESESKPPSDKAPKKPGTGKTRKPGNIPMAVGVLVIAAVAAAIVLPRLLEEEKPQVSRIGTNLRSLATALESYYVDQCSYPAMRLFREQDWVDKNALRAARGWDMTYVEPGGPTLAGLTTPVAYASSLYPDEWAPCKGMSYSYYADINGWILISPGPDLDYDIVPARDYSSAILQPSSGLLLLTFDPTNGATSDGDIWRVKQ